MQLNIEMSIAAGIFAGVGLMQRSTFRYLVSSLVVLGGMWPMATIAQDSQINPNPASQFPVTPQTAPSEQPMQTEPGIQPAPTETIPPLEKPAEKPAEPVNQFPTNPLLDTTIVDPLLPTGLDQRPPTAAERKRLIGLAAQLDAQAQAQLKVGDRIGAFETWNRELRLWRYLGPVAEVKALGRVGDTAWKENDTPQVRWITERLNQIFDQAKAPSPGYGNNVNLGRGNVADWTAVLDALGPAYEQVRLPQSAVAVYQLILTQAEQRRDTKKIDQTLVSLGQLHLSWFDYPNAAATYQRLLERVRSRRDTTNEAVYLNQLAYIYEQAKQPARTIFYQEQLISLYQRLNDPKPIPGIRLKIAENYQLLSRPDLAERNYQAAYQLAQPLAQFAYASDALKKLGDLYLANNRLDAALRVYNFLIAVEQQAYNVYGMMYAYDRIGQIQATRKNYAQAIAAFQRGLALARQLKHKEAYFTTQIQQVAQQSRQ